MRWARASASSACPAPRAGRPRRGPSRGWAAFTSFRADRILALRPDLVLAFSDLQAEVAAELIRAGLPVLCTNPRSIEEMFAAILLVGGALGLEPAARAAVLDMRDEIRQVREFSSMWPDRPRVYFEEWPEPPMAGIRWASEIVEMAGGRDIFPELRDAAPGPRPRGGPRRRRAARPGDHPGLLVRQARGRRPPSRNRPGWDGITAVRRGEIHEIEGSDILAPGPVPHGRPAPDPRDHPAVARPGLTSPARRLRRAGSPPAGMASVEPEGARGHRAYEMQYLDLAT